MPWNDTRQLWMERYYYHPPGSRDTWFLLPFLLTLSFAGLPFYNFQQHLGGAAYLIDVGAFVACVLSVVILWFTRDAVLEERELPESRHSLSRQAFVDYLRGVAIIVIFMAVGAVVVVVGLSAIVYDLAAHHQSYNPFEQPVGPFEVFLFFVDQALKGGLFDIMEVFQIHLQDHLSVNAWRHFLFGCVLVAFRSMMSLFVIGTIITIVQCRFRFRKA